MAKAAPAKEFLKIPYKTEALSDGGFILTFPDINAGSLVDLSPLSTQRTAEDNNSFSVGYFDEAWLEKFRRKLDDLESHLMRRMIKDYYGLWPDDCIEYRVFKYTSSLFTRLEPRVLRRAILARHLFNIAGKLEYVQEYITRMAEFKKLNLSLPNPIYQLYVQFGVLEQVCLNPNRVKQHPEVVAFLDDLGNYSEEFRNSSCRERSEAMADCTREMEQKLKIK